MDPKTVLDHARKLCDDLDASRPIRYGLRRVVLPFAVPAALGLGVVVAGCEEVCDNGLDDNDDGLVDCDDEDCSDDRGCREAEPGCEPRVEYCEDEFDNDGNGDTDCDDLCCDAFCFERDCPMCDYGVPFEPLDAEEDCADGRDEDCDGQTDCCDRDCDADPGCA